MEAGVVRVYQLEVVRVYRPGLPGVACDFRLGTARAHSPGLVGAARDCRQSRKVEGNWQVETGAARVLRQGFAKTALAQQ